MPDKLSGVAIIICISIGFITFILLFIFGKRQIMRFALKSRRGPHVPIALEASKKLKREIERRFEVVKEVKYEPPLLVENCQLADQAENQVPDSTLNNEGSLPSHSYRMKAVDSLLLLEKVIIDVTGDNNYKRVPGQDLRFYLLKLGKNNGPMASCDTKLINNFVDAYNHARHEPTPFGVSEYEEYTKILGKLIEHVNTHSSSPSSRSSGPTPTHQRLQNHSKNTEAQIKALNGKTKVRIITNESLNKASQDKSETSV